LNKITPYTGGNSHVQVVYSLFSRKRVTYPHIHTPYYEYSIKDIDNETYWILFLKP